MTQLASHTSKPSLDRWGINRVVQIFVTVVVMATLLFLSAGRLDWTAAWVFIGLYVLALLTIGLWVIRKQPDLVNERGRIAENTKSWDKVLVLLYTVMITVLLVVAGLDAGRWNWSSMPLAIQALGVAGLVLGMAGSYWAMLANRFLSSTVRIQSDRGHQVASGGPYRYVRHPMYVSMIILWPSISLLLGSWWALIPSVLIIVIFVIRTALEDKTLQAELPGYAEYAERVRYRLVPGIW